MFICYVFIASAILTIIISLLFDKGNRYTSPDFENKVMEKIYYTLAGIDIGTLILIIINLFISIFRK